MGRRIESLLSGIVLSVVVAACAASTPTSAAVSSPTPTPSAASTETSPSPAAPASPSSSPTAKPATAEPATAEPTITGCTGPSLAARVVSFAPGSGVVEGWQGAAGSRFADVEMTNTGSTCTLPAMSRPQLIDGHGAVLIDGAAPAPSATLTLAPGAVLKATVRVGNYCGPQPAAPVTVAFLVTDADRVIAQPVTQTDISAVPPCNATPGSAGDIEMQAWAP